MHTNHKDEFEATGRAMIVLVRETTRAAEAAERVRLVTQAVALRYGVVSAGACAARERQA